MTIHEAPYVPDVVVIEEALVVQSPRRKVVARRAVAIALFAALGLALWMRRDTVTGAFAEIRSLPALAAVTLAALTAYERWSRADIVRRLLGEPVGIGTAVVIHEVGTAVSKGVPLGGALGTALRWSIAREHRVLAPRFATMLIAYGIATTFVNWLLPFGALLADLTQRSGNLTDLALLAGIGVVVVASAGFWLAVLRSDRLEAWATSWLRRAFAKLSTKLPGLAAHDPAAAVGEVRGALRAIARRPVGLLARTLIAQSCGSLILLVALRGVGVGDELGVTEFLRVFFVAHLLGTFAPTPGGVGVVEAGVTGALVAAGVDTEKALAGVLVYRFLTYILPIVFGAALWLAWRSRRPRTGAGGSVTLSHHGASIDTAVPDLPCVADQGFCSG